MTVILTMRGMLEPIELEDNFAETISVLNNSAAKGMEFVVTRKNSGENIVVKMDNILMLEEVEEDEEQVRAF